MNFFSASLRCEHVHCRMIEMGIAAVRCIKGHRVSLTNSLIEAQCFCFVLSSFVTCCESQEYTQKFNYIHVQARTYVSIISTLQIGRPIARGAEMSILPRNLCASAVTQKGNLTSTLFSWVSVEGRQHKNSIYCTFVLWYTQFRYHCGGSFYRHCLCCCRCFFRPDTFFIWIE